MSQRIVLCLAVLGVVGFAFVPSTAHSTVANTTTTVTYTGNGGTEYAVAFGWVASSDLSVVLTEIATGTAATMTEDTHYTVARVGSEGGTVTFENAVTSSYTITISRSTPKTQATNYRSQGRFLPSVLETSLDKLTMLVQEALSGVAQSEDTEQAVTDHIASSDDHSGYVMLAGRATGQAVIGGTASGDDLDLTSTSHATKGLVTMGVDTLVCDATNSRVGINDSTPDYPLDVVGDIYSSADVYAVGNLYGSAASGGDLDIVSTVHATKGDVTLGATMTVDQTNTRVGVNDTTPSYDLDVTGDIYCTADTYVVGNLYGSTASGGDLTILSTDHLTKGDITLGATMTVDQTNLRVGINDATPSYSLEVTGDAYVSTDLTVGVDTLFVDESASRVGINDATPGYSLEVTGDAYVSTDLTVGVDTLFVDESASRVGINDATPSYALDVTGSAAISSTAYVPTIYGGIEEGSDLKLRSTTDATKGGIELGTSVAMYIDDVNTRVGVGTIAPASDFEIASGTSFNLGGLIYNTGANNNVGIGEAAPTYDFEVDAEFTVAMSDLIFTDPPASAVGIGTSSPACTLEVSGDSCMDTLQLSVNTTSDPLQIKNDGNLASHEGATMWVGLDAPGAGGATNVFFNLNDGNGDPICTIENTNATTIAFVCPSDVRMKKNIRPSNTQGLATINALPMRQYDWIDEEKGHVELGMVAQEVEAVYPPMVNDRKDGMKSIATSELVPVLVKAVQELSAQVEALQEQADENYWRSHGGCP